MVRTIIYWTSTAIACLALLMALTYLTGNEQVTSGFANAGYPQHLRIVLGIAKPTAAIILLLPGLALLKEWAYAGATITWVMAFISAYSRGEGAGIWSMPLVLLVLLIVSYVTRPPGRQPMFAGPSASAALPGQR
jgi:Na+(H+)/acetate symporter ActP